MLKKIITNKIFLIFVLALILRLGFLIFFPPLPMESSDAFYYNEVALNFLSGKGITFQQETFSIPPVYPLFLAGIYKVFGYDYNAVRIVQTILSALICVLVYLLARNLFNRKAALIAGLIAVIYPSFILQSTAILTETLFTFLLVLAMFCLVLCLEKSSIKWGLATGISLGLATLTRSVALFFPVLILPLVFLYKKKQPIMIAFRNFLLIVLAMFLIMSPWIFRDYLGPKKIGEAEGKPGAVKLSQKLSGEIVAGGDIGAAKGSMKKIIDKDSFFQIISNLYRLYRHPYALSDVTSYGYKEVFFKFIHGEISFKELLPILKQGTFWLKIGILLFYYLILVMALLGLIFGYKKWRRFLSLILIIIYITLPHVIPGAVGRVNVRYIFPIMPFIIILAGYGVTILKSKIRISLI